MESLVIASQLKERPKSNVKDDDFVRIKND